MELINSIAEQFKKSEFFKNAIKDSKDWISSDNNDKYSFRSIFGYYHKNDNPMTYFSISFAGYKNHFGDIYRIEIDLTTTHPEDVKKVLDSIDLKGLKQKSKNIYELVKRG